MTAELFDNDSTYEDDSFWTELRRAPGMLVGMLRDGLRGLLPGLTRAA